MRVDQRLHKEDSSRLWIRKVGKPGTVKLPRINPLLPLPQTIKGKLLPIYPKLVIMINKKGT